MDRIWNMDPITTSNKSQDSEQSWRWDLIILIDTREQIPLWWIKDGGVVKQKLDVGDYTTLELRGQYHAERKTPMDLYQTITRGHVRFRKEILRAKETGVKLEVFVECSQRRFVNKTFATGRKLKVEPMVLAKIINTLKDKYSIDFIWCKNRDEMRDLIKEEFRRRIKCQTKLQSVELKTGS